MSAVLSQPLTEAPAKTPPPESRRLKLAYVVSRFPKPTETFVLSELEALRDRDVPVEVFPLLSLEQAAVKGGSSLARKVVDLFRPPEPATPKYAAAARWQARARYGKLLSVDAVQSMFGFLLQHPVRLISALSSLVFRNLGSLRYLGSSLVLFPRMVQIARDMQCIGITHVHAHFANSAAAAALTIHRLTGLPFSFTAHGSDLHRDQHMLKQKVEEAAFVVCISEFNRHWALEHSAPEFAEKTKVVHCGVNTGLFAPSDDAAARRSETALRVLQIGTLHEVKGQAVLLRACATLVERGVPFQCEFVGDGPDSEMLQQLVTELGLCQQVTFHGYRPPQEVRELLSSADVLACPSIESSDGRREGIPVVLMEAMACGVPVVASRLSGIPELVESGSEGLLVEPGDPIALANAFEFAANSPQDVSRFAKAARQKVLSQFDQRKNIDQLITLFEESAQC